MKKTVSGERVFGGGRHERTRRQSLKNQKSKKGYDTVAFLDSLSKVSGGALGGSVAASVEDCQSNIREIVQVRWQGQGGEEGEGVVADGSGNGGVGGGYGGGETKT